MRKPASRWATCSGLVLCSSILLDNLFPATSRAALCEPSIAKAMAVEGKVDARSADSTQWRPVKLRDTFCPGDVIRVQERSRADIALSNQPMLRLDQNTTMTLGGVKKQGGSVVELTKGAMHFFSRLPRNLDIKTAFVNAGVEGTEGVVSVGDEKAEVTIFEGKVVAANESGTVTITNGQSVVAETGKPLAYQTVVKPRDAVQWALHYPPVIDRQAGEVGEAQSLTNRAADALAVGRVEEAKTDLDRALKVDPRSADALALQSIIAVVQNDKEQALGLATSAVAANPQSASAKIALSYAQQANFDVEGALKSLQEAVKAEPNNALAWSRLAEMHLSLQQLDKGLEAAQKAVELNPNAERAHTVLGFAYLLQVKTKEAQAEFQQAHEIDQAAALPQLGLGLAKFREGKVEEGRREMEVAASLDPNNSMIRSYLGKAYFEEKKTNLTNREYQNAKELDPKDPTPFFYDALQKQLTNRPVEALKDMETAIENNKNRAVYRSQLQMDSDVAARSASLGRIYQNLGFQYQALVEGWRSINMDPASFTASRFLADSYASQSRHEIARVSELLRSQLLQPINITPIQPSQAVSNLFLMSSLGPTATSFNEFNTLMVNRDRVTVLSNGIVGSQGTLGGEAIVSGIYKKVSFSAGWNTFYTDGWRTNANQRDNLGNLFVQYELSPNTNIQVEYRYRKLTRGDNSLRFFEDDFLHNFTETLKTNTYRLGLRHNLAPNSIILANGMYQAFDSAGTFVGPAPINFFTLQQPQSGWAGEIQHLFLSQYVNTTIGAGTFYINGVQRNIGDIQSFCAAPNPAPPPDCLAIVPAQLFSTSVGNDVKHTNVYGYSYIKPIPNVIATLGVSADFVNSDDPAGGNTNQVNPKFGLIWEPLPGTTFRAAAFRTLKRTLLANQTIEPTQVAGFNQFYDDINSAEAWRYAVALNQKFRKGVYVGGEYSYRQIKTPFTDLTDPNMPVVMREPQNDYQGRGYLFWTPHDWVALRTELIWDLYKTAGLTDQPRDLTTYRVPLGINAFHPSGISAFLTGTYWNQDGTFLRLNGDVQSGRDTFWLVDVGVSYRLPKRYGLLMVGVQNLLDQSFQFFDRDISNPIIQPNRLVFTRLTLAFP